LDQRSDPRVVPGIEAQMPESPFLRTLLAGPGLDDGLGSITGDVQASGLLRRLKVVGADLFYRGPVLQSDQGVQVVVAEHQAVRRDEDGGRCNPATPSDQAARRAAGPGGSARSPPSRRDNPRPRCLAP
jgi:hypothetical protein